MDRVTVAAPAKLNLRLAVGPRGPDGYHQIRSLMVALEGLEDTLTVTSAEERSVLCAEAGGPANLAWRALDALERLAGRPLPCTVEIDKRIPSRAGLGGGSSDAAATLLAAERLFGLDLDAAALEKAAADVGSDVAFFVRGGAQWATGRGQILESAACPSFAALIVVPAFGLPTGDVYRAFDRLPAPAPHDGTPPPSGMPDLAGWVRNDLWPAARTLRPELGAIEAGLREAGAATALLCGSGSAMAGLFATPDEAREASARWSGACTVVTPARP
jgi:4-diphosphocytidyl-2-C-methyl-D-erythritol kinase